MLKEMEDPVYLSDLEQGLEEDKVNIAEFYRWKSYDLEASEGWKEFRYDSTTGREVRVDHPGAGRPLFKDEVWVRIRAPGNKDEIRERKMRESDKIRFPKAWARFNAIEQSPDVGTPFESVPWLRPAQIAEYKGMGLRTVEDFVNISDANGQKIMGFAQLRRRLADFLEAANGAAPILAMRGELEQKEAELAELRQQMADLAAHVGAPTPKRRGRPPKAPPPPPVDAD